MNYSKNKIQFNTLKQRYTVKHAKKYLFLAFFLLILLLTFSRLGSFLDCTQAPERADLIVSLGGDKGGSRLQKALQLYKGGFSASEKLLYTGTDRLSSSCSASQSRKAFLVEEGMAAEGIVHIDETIISNTMEEVFFIKAYMQKHFYSSVIFVSHPHHSRRIAMMAEHIAGYGDTGLHFVVVSTEPLWWDAQKYFTNELSLKVTLYEVLKLGYNLLKYKTPLIACTAYAGKVRNKEWEAALAQLD